MLFVSKHWLHLFTVTAFWNGLRRSLRGLSHLPRQMVTEEEMVASTLALV
jgi:hypothetical protein